MITQRRLVPELMDDPAVDRDELAASLQYIRKVNARLSGTAAALEQFQRWSRQWTQGEIIRILDVGTGSADIPIALTQWARRKGVRVHVTAVDLHEKTLELARGFVGDEPDIELVQADALRLTDIYQPGSFDYAHAGMFLHHLEDIEVMTVLRIMQQLTRKGVIWNDLIRGTLARLGVRLATLPGLGVPAMARHDARVSVNAGFTKAEAIEMARRVGLENVMYRTYMLYRFTLVSTKQ